MSACPDPSLKICSWPLRMLVLMLLKRATSDTHSLVDVLLDETNPVQWKPAVAFKALHVGAKTRGVRPPQGGSSLQLSCDYSTLRASRFSWIMPNSGGGDWYATNYVLVPNSKKSFHFKLDDWTCKLTGVALESQDLVPSLRLQFDHCKPKTAISIRLERSESGGSNLVPWMCQIMQSSETCELAQQALIAEGRSASSFAPATAVTDAPKQKGAGYCLGPLTSERVEASSLAQCNSACAAHVLDGSTCAGFAYREQPNTCLLYHGSRLEGADGHGGFTCYKPVVQAADLEDVELDIREALNTGTITRAKFDLDDHHFEPGEYFIADASLPVPSPDWDMLMKLREMVAPKEPTDIHLGGRLAVDRICFTNCSGYVHTSCQSLLTKISDISVSDMPQSWSWYWILIPALIILCIIIMYCLDCSTESQSTLTWHPHDPIGTAIGTHR